MWYTSTGSGIKLSQKEKVFLGDLAECLANSGWSLRTAGRGAVDDVMHKSAVNAGGVVNTYVPFAHYRGYDAHSFKSTTTAFNVESPQWQGLALAKVEGDTEHLKFRSELARNLLGCTVPVLMGAEFNAPSRFLITWQGTSHSADGDERDDLSQCDPSLFKTPEAPIYYLAKSKQIPIFNLANPLHMKRVELFIEGQRERVSALA